MITSATCDKCQARFRPDDSSGYDLCKRCQVEKELQSIISLMEYKEQDHKEEMIELEKRRKTMATALIDLDAPPLSRRKL